MTVHFFTRAGEDVGDSRHRAFQVVNKLNARGIAATIQRPPAILFSSVPWPQKFSLIAELIRSLSSIKKGDIVYLQRTVSNKYFFVIMVAYLFLFRRKMIFDFCDPIYVVIPFKTKVFTRMADAVIVSTHAQVKWARRFNNRVYLFHISLDAPAYAAFTREYAVKNSPIVIGWIGTATHHIPNLEILASVFEKLLKKTDIPFKFVLIGAVQDKRAYELFQSVLGLSVEFVDALDWNDPESVPREIQKFDIGVIPHSSETEWNRSKTSLKILEYMACGVATIASAAGELPYIIQDGVNGYLASTDEEWAEKLAGLLSDAELRARLGRAGQERVRKEYSHEAMIPRLIELINSLSRSTIG